VTGWAPPTGPNPPGEPPIVGWATPSDEGLGVGAAIRAGWDLTRDHLAGLATVAAVPVLLSNILLIPVWLGLADQVERVVRFMSTLDLTRYRTDSDALQREFQAIFQQSTQFVAVSAALSGIVVAVAIIGSAALTRATLDAVEGRPVTIGRSFAAVAAHASAIVVPAIVLGILIAVGSAALNLGQTNLVAAGGTPGQAAITSLASLLGLVLWIVLIILAIRWSVVFQAILAEDLGLGAALSRSAALTSGARVRIGLTLVAAVVLTGVLFAIVASFLAMVVGLVTSSIANAFVAYAVVTAITGLVLFPFLVSVLTLIYRDRVAAKPAAVTDLGG
jgi:hypothetical protein